LWKYNKVFEKFERQDPKKIHGPLLWMDFPKGIATFEHVNPLISGSTSLVQQMILSRKVFIM
ncbi:TPA: hypothetical protein ACG93Y_003113, partial [Enterococcus faecium]